MSDKSGQYLTVNNEDFVLSPVARKRHVTRKNRLILPDERVPSPAVSFDESLFANASASSTEDLRPSSANSYYNPVYASDSIYKHRKSIDNLCFGRKKLYRQAQINEIYRPRCNTDPGLNGEKPLRHLTIPILRIPEDESTHHASLTIGEIPSAPTSRVPSPSLVYERKRSGSSGVLGSFLKQTIKVTTASMGFRAASMDRLAPTSSRPLNEDVKQRFSRSTSSVSTLAQLPASPMAPLQTHTEYQSVQCLNISDRDYKSATPTNTTLAGATTTSSSSPPQNTNKAFQPQLSITESQQSTSIGCATSSEYSSARSLKHSAASSLTPQPAALNSSGSFRSISPSRRSASSNSSSTAKHEQSTAAATAAAAATATTSNGSSATIPPEKEKKRKEISSSRVKKFHRHFSQVSKDEKLINYFSCALVSDILLQGHLYITDQHFAFYSNVFGYVTKVVIPTSSVTRISKEKTAKIIPNAVGVATADERHVFGSFISRESAFRLMCSVCPPLGVPEILPKDPANIEISEECSIEDDSSCSISGNESPAQITDLKNSNTNGNLLNNDSSQTLLRRSAASSNLSITEPTTEQIRQPADIPIIAKTVTNAAFSRHPAPLAASNAHYANGTGGGSGNLLGHITSAPENEPKLTLIAGCASSSTTASSTPTPSTSSLPTTMIAAKTLPNSKVNHFLNALRSVNKKVMLHVKFPTEIHVVYLGVMLTLLLALFSLFLLYRILIIEAKTSGYHYPVDFNWQRSGNDDDIFREALRFQKQLQLKSTEEAQSILKTNLEQIAKVRRSLETLSMLIHDRSSSYMTTNTEESD